MSLFLEDVRFGVDLQTRIGQPEAARQRSDRDEHRRVARIFGALDRDGDDSYSFSISIVRSARPGVSATNRTVVSALARRRISATQSWTRPWNSIAGWQRITRGVHRRS